MVRSADAPASSLPRSRSPTCSSPSVTGHRWPSRQGRGSAQLWRREALRFTGKWAEPPLQLPITGSAHKAANGRRPLAAATGTARSARRAAAREWLAEREAELLPVPYFHVVYTLPAPRSATSPTRTRRRSTICLFKAAAETTLTIAADPKHLGAQDRHHRGAAHLGLGHDAPSARAHDRARWRKLCCARGSCGPCSENLSSLMLT